MCSKSCFLIGLTQVWAVLVSVDCVTVDSFHADPVGETDYLDKQENFEGGGTRDFVFD